MKVRFHDPTGRLSESAIKKAHSRLASSLSKFGNRVQSVVLSVSDLNGPKGGIDMEINLLVRLRQLGDVVVSAKDESLSKAIAKAMNRSERAIARRLQRSSIIDRDRRSGFGFAFYQ